MAVEDKDNKIKALRGALKNGRIAKSGTDIGSDDRNNDPAPGADFQNAGRAVASIASNSNRPQRNKRQPGGDERGTTAKFVRQRPADRRSGEGDSSVTLDPAGSESADTRVVGRIFSDVPVPERVELNPDTPDPTLEFGVRSEPTKQTLSSKYPESNAILSENPKISVRKLAAAVGVSNDTAQRIKKEWEETHPAVEPVKQGIKIPTLPKGNVLTKSEAADMAESFISALESDFMAIDQYLWHRQMNVGIDNQQQPVWSDMDSEELEKISKIMLRWGQHNEIVAAGVRGVNNSGDYVAVASALVPRVKTSIDIYKKTRKPRARRGQAPTHEA